MEKYKVWVHLEIEDDEGDYRDMHPVEVGEYGSLEEAQEAVDSACYTGTAMPELLEAAKALLAEQPKLGAELAHLVDPVSYGAAIRLARAAITKAEGGT